ncbi:putative iron-dependent peroxidase [Neisseria sp. HSC-16F19]|nr:Dyp-type peroxidase [Neisseria sp. HSC-16F19]MCP2039826.1 putative iron-dependent peroxidase [Neisseria sp. HSC-16F19]
MSTPQSTVLPENMSACIVIEADVTAGRLADVAQTCRQLAALLERHRSRQPQAHLGLAVGFAAGIWPQLRRNDAEGAEIKPFRPLGNGLAPATQHDIAIHIQSQSHGANMLLALDVLAAFGDALQVADETHGCRLFEDRGYDGFVDGTENPTDEQRPRYGVIAAPAADAGGSYLMLQKYRHDLKRWAKLDDAAQSHIIGRNKADDEELPGEARLPGTHLARVDLKENGEGLKIIRQSLPYGTASGEHGLLFIAYCARLHNIEQQLLSMFGETDGHTDLLLEHLSTAVSGSYYFVPSEERLADLAG